MTYHPRVTREQAEQRALQMINLTWELTQANKQRPADCNHDDTVLKIPDHVLEAPVGATMTGIPYCVTGGNGLEFLEGACAAKKDNFADAILHGKIAGNVGGAICDHAAGLDCSGYASSVYKYQNKYYSEDFLNAGINLGACENYTDLNAVLDKMDLCVQLARVNHIFLFLEQKMVYKQDNYGVWRDVPVVSFYNCSRRYGNEPDYHSAKKCEIDKYFLDDLHGQLTLHKMWNCTNIVTYSDNNFHKSIRSCGVCDTTTYYIPHAVAGYSSYNGLYHSGTCRFCSGQVIEAHKYSSTTGPCTICGYNGPRPVNPNLNKDKALSGQDIAVAE